MYRNFFKRVLDFLLSFLALIILSPLMICLVIVGSIKMGGNPFFTQIRPGKNDKLFKLIKFRTMNNKTDSSGKLLPDEERLNAYGKFLRASSLDELPELINIILGDMAIVGPRPQLVRDMVFMDKKQRQRHLVRQGLTGLAQINGRNNISWENKIEYDLQYISNISLLRDLKILLQTIGKVLEKDGINEDGQETAMDYGDYLLLNKKVSKDFYDKKLIEADNLLKNL